MAAKTSQLYLVFQNKAHHYQNLQAMKPKVEDHLSHSVNHTINAIGRQKYDRDFPVEKRYSINAENTGMTDRLSSIYHTGQKVIANDGNYARSNKFQRQFRNKNPFKSEEDRLIHLQNEKIKQKIGRMQSGSSRYWKSEYKEQRKFTKNMESFEQKSSRTSLHIDTKTFLAKPYLEFIHNLRNERSTLDESIMTKKSTKSPDIVSLESAKLFELPQYPPKQSKISRSKVSLASLETIEKKE